MMNTKRECGTTRYRDRGAFNPVDIGIAVIEPSVGSMISVKNSVLRLHSDNTFCRVEMNTPVDVHRQTDTRKLDSVRTFDF